MQKAAWTMRFSLEALFNFVLLALGIAIVVVSLRYGTGTLARPGPGLYPACLGVAIAVCAFFVLLAGFRSGASAIQLEPGSGRTLLMMAAVFCLWIALMPWLGYVIVTLLAVFAFCKIMRLEGWQKPLALAGGTALFIYLLFDHWLYVDLPRGILA